MSQSSRILSVFTASLFLLACGGSPGTGPEPKFVAKDPQKAEKVSVDRFAEGTGHLMVRTAANGLPGPNAPVDFDQAPFITRGLGPDGRSVQYYNFDVMPTKPAPIYVLFRQGETMPLAGQLNIVDVIPGDPGYSDFWNVVKVIVPADYVANAATSLADLVGFGFSQESTNILVNCPVVPDGSTAKLRAGGSAGLTTGWYKGKTVRYFSFEEKALTVVNGNVPVSPIYVTFNVNPDQPEGGPGSNFVTEPNSAQTHNVVATLPADAAYSPLWSVNVYDNADFGQVSDLGTATQATVLGTGVALVNCPVVTQ